MTNIVGNFEMEKFDSNGLNSYHSNSYNNNNVPQEHYWDEDELLINQQSQYNSSSSNNNNNNDDELEIYWDEEEEKIIDIENQFNDVSLSNNNPLWKEVCDWLQRINMLKYKDTFLLKGYDEISIICYLEESDLKTRLQIHDNDISFIWSEIEKLKS
eukprot:TRINITY_DN3990_c0_g1_i1.p1 TRINITY_DN3990_c0_g1~~TRINITY_DN3990_c0_g1_i1.p1  ORF type:complete len:157 (-),score=52.45 TRINITY_DN3990_c0_g1_i1:127-597(-)